MLHRNMTKELGLAFALEDLLADLRFCRRNEQVGRLAFLAFCDVKAWARSAGNADVAHTVHQMFLETPYRNKNGFLAEIDNLISTLELQVQESQRNYARRA
jgi:hypothetical protein